MKILFISDIHGIIDNLSLIENKMEEHKIDKLVCLGDMYYCGPTYNKKYEINSNGVFEFLKNYKTR